MGYAKEKGKLEILSTKVSGLKNYDDKSLAVITDIFEQYSHILRILKNKNSEVFISSFQTDLEDVKLTKRELKISEELDREENFTKYKASLSNALKSLIKVIEQTA